MLLVVRVVVPGNHRIEVFKTFNEHPGFFHIAKAYRTFNPLQVMSTSYFFNLCYQGFGNLKVINGIVPAKTHLGFSLLINLNMIYDSSDTSYRLSIF